MWIKGEPQAKVTMYETADAKKYKKNFIANIQLESKKQNWIKSENKFQKYYVDCYFYFPRIDMDSNNTYKLLLDSITESGVVWFDDTQACERTQGIFYDTENPRIEIEIFPVDFVGIFSQEQLENFKSNCIQCTKYKEGKCNILIKALEGRIQEEITNSNCNKFKSKKGNI